MFKLIKITVFSIFVLQSTVWAESAKMQNVDKIKKAIVTIDARIPVSAYENTGNWTGTGFIVDKKNGYLVTNHHVVGRAAVGTYFITFHNGQQTEAKLVYYDLYADFAILKIDPKSFPEKIEVIEFANESPKIGSDVFIVGNTEGQGFSFHTGYLSDLYEISGGMPQASYIVNMNTIGGASGSPVLNANSKAIAILYGGGKTHALVLKISYVEHALKSLQSNKSINRQHIGVITNLYSLDKAVKHRNFSPELMAQYIKNFPDAKNRVVNVASVLPNSTAESIILAGDILWEVDNKPIGADLSIVDDAMNNSTSGKIKLTIIRNGNKIEKDIPLYDLEKNRVSKMLDFAGGLFFEADDFIAAKSGIPIGSVSMVHAQRGSSFNSIPESRSDENKDFYRVVIKSINNIKINSLNEMVLATDKAINQKYINIEYKNYQPYYPKFGANEGFISAHENLTQDITFDSIETKPRILKFDDKKHEWVSEGL